MHHEPEAPPQELSITAVCGLDDPVRRGLYEYVCGSGEAVGRDEAAGAVGVSRPLAAYHLDKLVGLGLLSATYQRPAGRSGPGAGRPAKVYIRSDREFVVTLPPREYELAARLLAQAVEADQSGAARTALRDAAHRLGSELGRSSLASGSPGPDARARLESALAEHGFEPSHDEAGIVSLGNCPFHQLAARHTDVVCGMNLALIAGLVDGIGGTGLSPALDPHPPRCCVVIRTCQQGTPGGRELS